MKNLSRLLGIIAIVAIIGMAVVSCGGGGGGGGKLSGTYKADGASITLTFSGKNITMLTGGYEMEGTFSTKSDEMTITWAGTAPQTVKYSIEGDKFTWTNQGIPMTFTKQ